MDDDATKPESSKSALKRKREEEAFEIVASAKEISTKKHTSSIARRTVMKTVDITQYTPVAKLYLSNIPTFTITPSPESDFFLSRKQFNKTVGGTTFRLFVTITKWKTASMVLKHPIHCVWPTRQLNPLTVDGIGAAGLLFAGRQDILHHSPLYVFRSVERDGTKWEYCGNYEAQKMGHLAVEHFRLYPETSKVKWGDKISTSRSKDLRLYLDMRVRIALRKRGEEITPDRVEREAQALIKHKDGEGMNISGEDVIEALCAGDEKIDVVLLRCVGYDHDFVHNLKRDVAAYIERGESPPKKKPRVAGKAERRRCRHLHLRRRRRQRQRKLLRVQDDPGERGNRA
ncbi:hypothetical protein CPB85DRAFT_158179 [Mucidula mucida]|nr:hypothetical protein CPB85DRAFT_158179 [Mucidula mucida]